MLKFSGKVLNVTDGSVETVVKTKDGLPTSMRKTYRKVSIQLLVSFPVPTGKKDKDGKPVFVDTQVCLNCVAFDPAADFQIPGIGEDWTTPEVVKYDASKGFPEVSFR